MSCFMSRVSSFDCHCQPSSPSPVGLDSHPIRICSPAFLMRHQPIHQSINPPTHRLEQRSSPVSSRCHIILLVSPHLVRFFPLVLIETGEYWTTMSRGSRCILPCREMVKSNVLSSDLVGESRHLPRYSCIIRTLLLVLPYRGRRRHTGIEGFPMS